METKRMPLRRLASGAGVLALVAAGVIGGASMASAAVPDDGTAPGNAAEGSTGTLIVHKHVGTTTDDNNNGTAQDVDRLPLAGVDFTVCKVGDLTTQAEWEAVASADPGAYTCAAGQTGSATLTTLADGTATFDELSIGLYKVVETNAPAGVTRAADFLVTIPFPSQGADDSSTWLWTVHTYPKNTIEKTSDKTVADPDTHGLGSLVEWTITSNPLGSLNNGQAVTAYSLIDELDDKLRYEETTSLVSVAPDGTETAVPGDQYTIDPAAAATAGGGNVTVTFEVDYVNGLPAGTYFKWMLTTEVTGIGALENKAFENPGTTNEDVGDATTDWGELRLLKVDATAETTGLAGAEFQVFNVNEEGTCTGDLGAPISVNDGTTSTTTFVSDADGVVEVAGLYVGHDGDTASRDYCVQETKAPTGYVADTAAFLVTVSPGAVAEGEYSHGPVLNTPVDGPMLPLTGSNGAVWFTVGGIALLAVAAGGFLMTRRSRIEE